MKTKTWLLAALATASLYVFFLVMTVPASWLAYQVSKSSLPVLLTDPAGTVWTGSATAVIRHRDIEQKTLGKVVWSINPLWLTLGRLSIAIDITDTALQASGVARISTKTIFLPRIDVKTTTEFLAGFVAPAALLGADGRLTVLGSNINLEANHIEGDAEIRIENITIRLAGPGPSGSHRIKVQGNGDRFDFDVSTLSGGVDISGSGSWHPYPTGDVRFAGFAKATTAQPVLDSILRRLGQPGANGKVPLNWRGRLLLPTIR